MEFITEDLEAIEAIIKERKNRELILNIAKYSAVGLAITLFLSSCCKALYSMGN